MFGTGPLGYYSGRIGWLQTCKVPAEPSRYTQVVSGGGRVEEGKGRGAAQLLEVIWAKGVGFIRELVHFLMQ